MMAMTNFDTSNLNVRQVITPDGIGSYVFKDADNPDKFYVQVKMPGKKIADFRVYTAE